MSLKERPEVSVVISVFNGESYLGACLDSVLAQQGVNFEVLAVDDGSTDLTAAILEQYAQVDSRVRIIRQKNTGLTQALVRGCAEVRGEFIARQDADDLSMPGRLAAQAAVLRSRPLVTVVSCWVRTIGPAEEWLGDVQYPEGEDLGTHAVLTLGRCPSHGSTMFRKADFDRVKGYRPDFYFAQDADLWFRLGDHGAFYFIPDILYKLRISESSITHRYGSMQRRVAALVGACKRARDLGKSEENVLAEARALRPGIAVPMKTKPGAGAYFLGRRLLELRDQRARRYLWDYFKRRPFDPRGWVSLVQTVMLNRKN